MSYFMKTDISVSERNTEKRPVDVQLVWRRESEEQDIDV